MRPDTLKWVSRALGFILGILVLSIVGVIIEAVDTQYQAKLTARQEVVCPSFLSIARSARDTLIVMRNESLCVEYVLEGLQ